MVTALVSANAALDLVQARGHALIDVRSEGEFAQGSVEGFVNAPILTNEERHLVGIAYKEQGQEAAVELGYRLVGPTLEQRVEGWRNLALNSASGEALVACWRGGLRSELACGRIEAAGSTALRVVGGYKAMRGELIRILEEPPPLLILGGLTGSGKTRLLRALPIKEKVDVEHLARHRGSSFGGHFGVEQPAQASFENAAAMTFRGAAKPVVIEDESATIGRIYLPVPLHRAMQAMPVVYVETALSERVRNLFGEYIEAPLKEGVSPNHLGAALGAGVRKLAKRLGGALAARIELGIAAAFAEERLGLDSHATWIELLLTEYYDKGYNYAFSRAERQVAFRGSYEECRQWILSRYA